MPAKRTRSFDDVVDQIRDAITTGKLQQGDRLPNERDLSRVFDISRSTLREGLRTLEAVGVIEIRPGARGGIFASSPDGDQVGQALEALIHFQGATADDLDEFRVTFEGENARWAAQRAKDEDVEELKKLISQIKNVDTATASWTTIVKLDLKFHEVVARATDNKVRLAIMMGLTRSVERLARSMAPVVTEADRQSVRDDLQALADAIESRDPQASEEAMHRHVQRFTELGVQIEHGSSTNIQGSG